MKTFCLLSATLLLLQCSSQHGATEKIVITGSSTVAPVIAEIAKRYESTHPGVQVDVQTGGSSRGVADARNGLADIGMVSRDLKTDEADLKPMAIARDGICLIVHAQNTISELSEDQVRAVFSGQIRDWQELGGPAGPITVVNKAEGRSTLELFLSYFGLKSNQIRADVVIGDNAQGLKTVMGNPGAIGYVSIGAAEYEARSGGQVRLLPMKGIAASVLTVANQQFPLARPLNLVTFNEPIGRVAEFLAYAKSSAVSDLIKAQYFVPTAP